MSRAKRVAELALAVALFAAWTAACREGEQEGEGATTAEAAPAALIVAPQDGDTVDGPAFTIALAVERIALRPAGVDEPASGHLHLFVDRELTPVGEVIPTEPGIVHLGQAQTEYLFENLEPGAHLVIAVLGDYLHARIPGARTDTVRLIVRAER